MRPIRQSEAAECGLACLAMVVGHYGSRVDLSGLRQRFSVSLKGATLKDLMRMADEMSFGTRALRLELDRLKDLALPAILHWDLNHFVVLAAVKGGRAHVLDPARGELKMPLGEVSKHFTGVVLELTPTAEFDGALAALAGRRATLVRQGAEVTRAPVAGRVAALPARAGQSVAPQTLLAAILPEGGVLEAELFVPTRAAGFIREGQEARLQFDAFPFQKFGWGKGRVVVVSKTIYSPTDIPSAIALQEPAFRVAVALDRPYVEAYGERFPVQAGMTLKADIVQEKRRLWRVFVDPLLADVRR